MTVMLMMCSMTLVMARKDRHPPINCTFEIIFPEFIFCECIYGLHRGPDETVSRAVYSPEAGGSPPLYYSKV